MVAYKDVIGIKWQGKVKKIEDIEDSALLVPEYLEKIVEVINRLRVNNIGKRYNWQKFENGYFWIDNKHFLRYDGRQFEVPNTICDVSLFSSDMAKVFFRIGKAGFIDGRTGKIKVLPEDLDCLKIEDFHGKYALVLGTDEKYLYLNKNLEMASSQKYEVASYFYINRAIVKTDVAWEIIDEDFKTITTFPKGKKVDKLFLEIVEKINYEAENFQERNIVRKNLTGGGTTFIDMDTGLSILTSQIIEELNLNFGLGLEKALEENEMSLKEQLRWIIEQIALKGTYMYNFESHEYNEVEIVHGLEISDGKNVITTFDIEGLATNLERKRKKN